MTIVATMPAAVTVALAMVAVVRAAVEGPCDMTGAAGNPCVAAHSTVRALYGKYDGGLYIVQKNHSQEQLTIGVLEPGGFANKAKHDMLRENLANKFATETNYERTIKTYSSHIPRTCILPSKPFTC